MPIDPAVAIGAELPGRDLSWTTTDVLLYHLTLGARATELRYVYERDLTVLPTFAVVTGTLGETEPPALDMPGVDISLASTLHGGEELVVHKPLPPSGTAQSRSRIADVYDKGSSAIIVIETVTDYFTIRRSVFVRGEGGFGGDRGPSSRVPPPDRAPDTVTLSPTWAEQALWYRLCGDRNPLHADPAFAAMAGFPAPILHGLCTYGMVCKAVVDTVLDGDPTRVAGFSARFSGVVYPGETLRTSIWRQDDRLLVNATVVERDAPALSDAVLTIHG
ncbi:MaoC/PaaZ C-terminal domain-containing protein [Phytohabitans rumicis]|uniref:3-alpha,7-alpha,12-alpha-trihydroxy-5-beta-cholest-24-enoyl-CoA hydratase n=1 Tax=Phytohabitans rumicis TaxID=1076125 RepID=A0A6V8LGP6_9ACTN|nr:MaoC/PaaZ C-terminal domain-containing protein [Phytohabitans rumicis]GFJ96432.1 3-alpha,7-alpha,12-alpha-trihydroxy-5-beta-cholest-24-enoyl-CoA hydratase [Phytohabitans rumicis]